MVESCGLWPLAYLTSEGNRGWRGIVVCRHCRLCLRRGTSLVSWYARFTSQITGLLGATAANDNAMVMCMPDVAGRSRIGPIWRTGDWNERLVYT